MMSIQLMLFLLSSNDEKNVFCKIQHWLNAEENNTAADYTTINWIHG